jgi:predicted outer membrane repeat protein
MGAYTNEIDFSGKVITIFGSNATLDAGKKGRFFNGDGSKGKTSLELHDVILKNGNVDDDSRYGGAIYIRDGTLVIFDSTFNANSVKNGNYYGGAICIDTGTLDIHDSTFDTNTGGRYGGAVYASSGVDVKIYTSIFERNSAIDSYRGGAIYVDQGTMEIYDSTFESNTALKNGLGGAIFVDGSLAAFNCTFHGNTAPAGGAVYVSNGANAIFTGCIFNGNDGSKGHNDIARSDDTSNVTFACANGTVGASVTMKAGESEIANPPPTSLKCTAQTYACYNGGKSNWKCVPDSTSPATSAQCDEVCAP